MHLVKIQVIVLSRFHRQALSIWRITIKLKNNIIIYFTLQMKKEGHDGPENSPHKKLYKFIQIMNILIVVKL